MSPFIFYLTHLAVLAYALVGGVFLAFSDFIMRALSLTGGSGGAEAMQAINREVFRWVFMTSSSASPPCHWRWSSSPHSASPDQPQRWWRPRG